MTSKIFLFEHPVSSYVQMVKIALREKGVDFTAQPPEDMMRASPNGAFAKANPRAEVPALIDGDSTILFETNVILEYINDKFPSPPLFPDDPAKRADMRLTGEVARTQYEAINWAIGEVRTFKRAEGELAAKIERNAEHALGTLHDWLEKRLGSSPYFSGSDFGYADICVAPVVNRSMWNSMGPAEGSSLYQWLKRIRTRPSVEETFKEFDAGIQKMAGMGGIFKQNKDIKREYRDHRLDFMIRAGGIDVVLDGLLEDNIRFSWPAVAE
jgi:glutathione S-transferase